MRPQITIQRSTPCRVMSSGTGGFRICRTHGISCTQRPATVLQQLPPSQDLRPSCPPVYDQGSVGSCTGNAIGGAFEFEQGKLVLQQFVPSRLFIYYNERVREGTVDQDSGARIRDGIKSVVKQGVCPEDEWPYSTD